MKQSKCISMPCNLLKAREKSRGEKSRVQDGIGFGFRFHWLINWREIYKPITKHSNCNRVIGLLQLTITWYKIHHAGGQAHYYSPTGTLKQRDLNQCGPVVRALALRSGDPGFKTRSDHSLNLILVVPVSTSQLHL